jgi:hypothetical protein
MVHNCSDAIIGELSHEIESRGSNKHPYPINIGFHAGRWWVNVEVDSPAGTFDIEGADVSLPLALAKALVRVRAEYGPRGRTLRRKQATAQ